MRSTKEVVPKTCLRCNKEFTPTRNDTRIKFCTAICNVKHWEKLNPGRKKKNVKKYMAAHPEQRKAIKLKHHYKMTLEQYNQMYIAQGGVCKICGNKCKSGRDLSVDHCHKTGKIRGLLCHTCNYMLGSALDNVEILKSGIEYLEANK